MWLGRILRIVTGLGFLAAAAVFAAPHATSHVSRAAVVAAPVTAVLAPFDGRLAGDPLPLGTGLGPGAEILTLHADSPRAPEIARLEAAEEALRGEVAAFEAEIGALRALDRDLARREALTERLLVDGLDATGERAGALRAAAVEGVLGASDLENATYVRQRRDEIAVRLADLRTRRDHRALRAAEAGAAVRRARGAGEIRAVRTASPAVVWWPAPAAGARVVEGDEIAHLAECGRRWIEVELPERLFGRIAPGDMATVRLRGAEGTLEAPVAALRGARALPETARTGATLPGVGEDHMVAILSLPPADPTDPAVAARFCDVGRSAEVTFARPAAGRISALLDRVTGRGPGAETPAGPADPPAAPEPGAIPLAGRAPDGTGGMP